MPTHRSRDTAPYDELGTPDDMLERCDCGVVYRVGGACLDCERAEGER